MPEPADLTDTELLAEFRALDDPEIGEPRYEALIDEIEKRGLDL